MAYYVGYDNNGKIVCGTWIRADSEDAAKSAAEFKIICHYPNVEYDDVAILEVRE